MSTSQKNLSNGCSIPEKYKLEKFERIVIGFADTGQIHLQLYYHNRKAGGILYIRTPYRDGYMWKAEISIEKKFEHLPLGAKLLFAGDAWVRDHVGGSIYRLCDSNATTCRAFVRLKEKQLIERFSKDQFVYECH